MRQVGDSSGRKPGFAIDASRRGRGARSSPLCKSGADAHMRKLARIWFAVWG